MSRRRVRATVVAGLTGLVTIAATVIAMNSAQAASTRYEAETSPATCGGTIDSNHAGYSGSGFCNSTNADGAAAQFTINSSGAGTATLGIRYANGGSGDRPANLVVNGATVQSAGSYGVTGAWANWTTKTVTVPVNAGNNTIRLVATGADGLANIDFVDFELGGDPGETTPPPQGDAIYVAPSGTSGAAGTISNPTTLASAVDRVAAGGTIYLRGGTYNYSQTVVIGENNNGLSGDRTQLFAYNNETPVLNFSAQSEATTARGLSVNGDYWHVRGIIVERAGDNGISVGGSNNVFERVVTRFNRDSGLQISRAASTTPKADWPANNLVITSESHDNADSDGEDADGFAAKLTVGSGNVFRNTVAHHNIDDGWDLYTKTDTGAIGVVTIENSLAWGNGTLSNGSQAGNGDRNGFKLGGEDISVNHIIRNNFAIDNGKHGFTYNRNLGSMTISGNVSTNNEERNFNFDGGSSVFTNNTSCNSGSTDRIIGSADGTNQFWSGSNGSRCSSYSGTLRWSFASDGRLVVTFG